MTKVCPPRLPINWLMDHACFDNSRETRYSRPMTIGLDITRLTPAERILLVQELWDSLAPSQESQPLTLAQQQEIERRLIAADRGEIAYSSWEDVKRRVIPNG